MLAYKFLEANGRGIFSNFSWPLPRDGAPGAWVESDVRPCHTGIHACRLPDLGYWMRHSLWQIELDGEIVESRHKVVAPRGRLVRDIEGYPAAARQLCAVSAWRTRDRAVTALRAEGQQAVADQLAACATLAEVEALAPVVEGELLPESHSTTAALMAFDAAHFVPEGHPREHSPFIAANAAGYEADDFDTGFTAERRFQSDWLIERLSLA